MIRISKGFTDILYFIMFFLSWNSLSAQDYPIQPVPFTEVKMTDSFWQSRMETNRSVTIPHAFKKSEETGRIDNFAIAGGLMEGEQSGIYPFDDTDVYKVLEGASYALMIRKDPDLEAYMDSVIALIAAAQEADGYIFTVRTNKAERIRGGFGDERWEKLDGSHELYNAGHLFEAAAAHYQATGKRNLLDIALKFADLIGDSFGPDKLRKPPGHQVIEMGLAKLYRVTGDENYIRLAKFFLDVRGKPLDGRKLKGEYNQDHMPVLDQEEAVGHAVRAGYMYAGMADVAALTGDRSYVKAINRIWKNVVDKKLYLTGGLGASGNNEGFSVNYDLPNLSGYNETCASIGNIFWNHRLFLLHGDSKYIDVLERTLYNALLSGISMDGMHFFYPNPLESIGQHERAEWFGCACCPGNVTRFMASLPGYVYAVKKGELFVNLYASNEGEVFLDDQTIRISQKTRYPWDGTVRITVQPGKKNLSFFVHLRIPGWCRGFPLESDLYRYINDQPAQVSIEVNGKTIQYNMQKGYAVVHREWQSGDEITLHLPMLIRRVVAHDSVKADRGRVALERGPLVFCAEGPDNSDGRVRNLLLPENSELTTYFNPDLLQGVQMIHGRAFGYSIDKNGELQRKEQTVRLIPYYAWAHRGGAEMTVWLAREEAAVHPVGYPTMASKSKVSASYGKFPEAVQDQGEPKSSNDHEVTYFHWWPHKGTEEWIQYDFEKPEEVTMVEVYWFDDTGRGECRVPKSWRVMYVDNGKWRAVYTVDKYGVEKDRFNKVVFETVRTPSLRLEIQSQKDWAGGIHEWRIE